jgi:hypothetical protein
VFVRLKPRHLAVCGILQFVAGCVNIWADSVSFQPAGFHPLVFIYNIFMSKAIDFLIAAQHESGGWGYSTNQQPTVEPTSVVLLALRDEPHANDAYQRGISWLINCQHQDGGWGIHQDDPESGWQTAWALISIKQSGQNGDVVLNGVNWLSSVGNTEISRSEFQGVEFPHNDSEDAYSWPWLPDQLGYVEPTAMAVLAFDGLSNSILAESRISTALQYFRIKRTSTGGWDSGYAGPLDVAIPRGYITSLVLIALDRISPQDILPNDISTLQEIIKRDTSILTQSSGLLALKIIGKSDDKFALRISEEQRPDGSWNANPFHTAWAVMALRGYFS